MTAAERASRPEWLQAVSAMAADAQTAEELLEILSILRGMKADLDLVIAAVESDAITAMGQAREVVVGKVKYARKRGMKKVWDDRRLAEAMCSPDELLRCAKIAYWRIGELEAAGLAADDFVEVSWLRERVVESIVDDDEHGLWAAGGEAVDSDQGRSD